jgi:hypothetical protein
MRRPSHISGAHRIRLASTFGLNLPPFPPAPWEVSRGMSQWTIEAEARLDDLPVASVPSSDNPRVEGQQRAAAFLIAASPALFMGAAALVKALEAHPDAPVQVAPDVRGALELMRHALDLARGRA